MREKLEERMLENVDNLGRELGTHIQGFEDLVLQMKEITAELEQMVCRCVRACVYTCVCVCVRVRVCVYVCKHYVCTNKPMAYLFVMLTNQACIQRNMCASSYILQLGK